MVILDVRRHTMRRKPGAHLSKAGIELAKFVARGSVPYRLVVTSEIPRAIETAIAMGFEVDELVAELSILPETILQKISWPNSLRNVAATVDADLDCSDFAYAQLQLWTNIAARIPDDGMGLSITHGGIIDLGTAASLMSCKCPIEGSAIGYCEGVRLHFRERKLTAAELLRVPEHRYSVEN
jgi:hypothetical protein